MPQRQIHHMDIIPDAGTVGRIIIVAVHHHFRPQPRRHLRHIGQQIVGNPVGVLAQKPAGMGADRIEIPQEANAPTGVRRC